MNLEGMSSKFSDELKALREYVENESPDSALKELWSEWEKKDFNPYKRQGWYWIFYDFMRKMDIWSAFAEKETGNSPSSIDATHSLKKGLFGRIFWEEKEVLPKPPPVSFSSPWYSLIEAGEEGLSIALEVKEFVHPKIGSCVNINQNPWALKKKISGKEFLIEPLNRHKEYKPLGWGIFYLKVLEPYKIKGNNTGFQNCILKPVPDQETLDF